MIYLCYSVNILWNIVNLLVNTGEEKVIPHLRAVTNEEVMKDLLKLLDLVQKHADKQGCKHCDKILKRLFETDWYQWILISNFSSLLKSDNFNSNKLISAVPMIELIVSMAFPPLSYISGLILVQTSDHIYHSPVSLRL